jgi:hypothetical protein
MIFNKHSNLAGAHAFLSASKYHWIRYDEDKLERLFTTAMEAQRGVELHDLAHQLIRQGVKLPNTSATLNRYVNDAIGFRMKPEQVLYYSPNCFGTADAIGFTQRSKKLRISDLKTGKTQASMDQLLIYAALFCLEYRYEPFDVETELRIYQNDDIKLLIPDPVDISTIMEKIKYFNKRLNALMEEAES